MRGNIQLIEEFDQQCSKKFARVTTVLLCLGIVFKFELFFFLFFNPEIREN